MKIAVCLSAHLKTYLQCKDNFFKNVIKELSKQGEVDIFISTWFDLYPERGWETVRAELERVEPEQIQQCYEPKLLAIDGFKTKKHMFCMRNFLGYNTKNLVANNKTYHDGMFFSTPMFYKIASANGLKSEYENSNSFKYDFVIRCRPDLNFTDKINLKILENLNSISITHLWSDGENRINDQFFCGTSEMMDKACAVFYNLTNITSQDRTKTMGPEAMLGAHFNLLTIPTTVIPQPFFIQR